MNDAVDAPPLPVSISCLGRLGRWGNQVLQYAFIKLYSGVHGLVAECPDWPGRGFLAEAAGDPYISCHDRPLAADRPVLSHKGWRAWASTREPLRSACEAGTPLSGRQVRPQHVRRLVPQVNGDSLRRHVGTPCGSPGGPLAGHDFWGWFMFSTSAFSPHRARFRELLRLQPGPAAALEAAVRSVGGMSSAVGRGGEAIMDVVAVHMRMGEGYSPVQEWSGRDDGRQVGGAASSSGASRADEHRDRAAQPAKDCHGQQQPDVRGSEAQRAAAPATAEECDESAGGSRGGADPPPAVVPGGVGLGVRPGAPAEARLPNAGGVESSTTGEWADTGVFWQAPVKWYADWLAANLDRDDGGRCCTSAASAEPTVPSSAAPRPRRKVIVFSDRPAEAREALGAFGAQSPADALGEGAYAALVSAFGGGEDGEALADFYLLSRCSTLLVSNSSFSFCAAMLAAAADSPSRSSRSSDDEAAACATSRTTFRPDPQQRRLVPFDPWDSSPTLKLAPA